MKKKTFSNHVSNEKNDLKKPLLIEAGKFLREKREVSGFSQSDIAKLAGFTSPQFISNIERGIALPSPHVIGIMVTKYQFEPEEFLELIAELKMEYYRRLFFPKHKKGSA
ncbi:MAG: XRE family transcriptional regulator [Proteobacteria bacterium]|nr:MAG: XRE family transcriptional regulator [Pseudomonadota bacterium]